MSDGGKGSRPRPFSVSSETFASNWDKIFKKNSEQCYPDDESGAQRINNLGLLEEYHEGHWSVVPFRSRSD